MNVYLHRIKLCGYRMGIKIGKVTLAVQQNSYVVKMVNS